MLTAEDIFGGTASAPIEVTMPQSKKSVRLRYPTFAEWYSLVESHRQLEGRDPPADLIARTLATCIAGPDGKRRLTDEEAEVVLAGRPADVIWLFKTCFELVVGEDAKK